MTDERIQPVKARSLTVVVSLAMLAAGVAGAPQASAAPELTVAQVQAQLDVLQSRAEAASEALNQAQVQLTTASLQVSVAKRNVVAAQKVVTAMSVTTDVLAAHMYVTDGANSSMSLLLSATPSTLLDRLAGVQQVARSATVTLRHAQSARLALAQTQVVHDQCRARAAAAVQQITAQRASINDSVAQQQKVLGQLKAEQRAQLAQIEAQARAASAKAADVARKARAAEASRATTRGQGGQAVSSDPVNGSTSASGRASIAIQYALAQVGKAYSFSAQPPTSWDCSKLTTAAWGKAGVSLSPYSYAQASEVRRISKDQLQPGDLLFYFNDAHHVAMYIGGGQIVEAASVSTGVQVTSVWNSWSSSHFSYAGRPLG